MCIFRADRVKLKMRKSINVFRLPQWLQVSGKRFVTPSRSAEIFCMRAGVSSGWFSPHTDVDV
jgi:hypothetical protein